MRVLTAMEVTTILRRKFPEARMARDDRTYVRPARDWLLHKFVPWYRAWLEAMGIREWRKEWDCDDFAEAWAVNCRLAHVAAGGPGGEAPAVGVLKYEAEGMGPHAVVWAVVEGDEVVVIEPQCVFGAAAVLHLSNDERRGAWVCER